ncbi:MAG: response regulator [Pirellulaceae bacterium]|jgi:CheY-like chemotaxis protein|nr:response regulator [Pirellulaceae bacterium]
MFEILLVEDNPVDVLMVEEAFAGNRLLDALHVVNDGDNAIAYLRRQGEHAEATRPDLILLDLNLPGTSGLEVLESIKADESLKRIPVVILTSSQSNSDRLACYNLHANAFMTKVLDFGELKSMVTTTCEYWFNMVKLPPH